MGTDAAAEIDVATEEAAFWAAGKWMEAAAERAANSTLETAREKSAGILTEAGAKNLLASAADAAETWAASVISWAGNLPAAHEIKQARNIGNQCGPGMQHIARGSTRRAARAAIRCDHCIGLSARNSPSCSCCVNLNAIAYPCRSPARVAQPTPKYQPQSSPPGVDTAPLPRVGPAHPAFPVAPRPRFLAKSGQTFRRGSLP